MSNTGIAMNSALAKTIGKKLMLVIFLSDEGIW